MKHAQEQGVVELQKNERKALAAAQSEHAVVVAALQEELSSQREAHVAVLSGLEDSTAEARVAVSVPMKASRSHTLPVFLSVPSFSACQT